MRIKPYLLRMLFFPRPLIFPNADVEIKASEIETHICVRIMCMSSRRTYQSSMAASLRVRAASTCALSPFPEYNAAEAEASAAYGVARQLVDALPLAHLIVKARRSGKSSAIGRRARKRGNNLGEEKLSKSRKR